MGDKLRFFAFLVRYLPGFAGAGLVRKLRALIHGWTYKGPTDNPKVVLVVGGSFAGHQLMMRLTESLPTGWQAVLVEKNEHFNWSFAMPRFSVVPGHEKTAFMAYARIMAKGMQRGIARFIRGEVVSVTADKHVQLASGDTVPYDILVVATGSAQRPPAKLLGSTHKDTACAELRTLQDRIRRARTVAVVGGGAVGIELVTDIKTYARVVAERNRAVVGEDEDDSVADKKVTIVHSRTQLLNRFGPRLHEHVAKVLASQDICIELGQRVTIAYDDGADESAGAGRPGTLHFPDGRAIQYDCILLCTGLTPNSGLFRENFESALTKAGEVSVTAGLQVVTDEKTSGGGLGDMYAFGDVAATGGPKMARAGFFQANVIVDNILASIKGRPATHRYVPSVIEPSLKLTLGKDATVVYVDLNKEQTKSILLPQKGDAEDMHVKQSWQFMGVKYTDEDDE
ncbi:hypothetical protein SEPCBS119000_000082 [Sporothrix epigloea]|uniref:FAD/NAD(P)-binding domain-containing protein n=1 Tax=Sporothrix epigloea TaxID=1892477 RepID=A0ABP0D351_9PEZI